MTKGKVFPKADGADVAGHSGPRHMTVRPGDGSQSAVELCHVIAARCEGFGGGCESPEASACDPTGRLNE